MSTVLGGSRAPIRVGVESRDNLERDVSMFLQSLRHFPQQPLPFPVVVYRDFFVAVAQQRSGKSKWSSGREDWTVVKLTSNVFRIAEERSIDACHTIDIARTFIETSSGCDLRALDRNLIESSNFCRGPFELTKGWVSLLLVLHCSEADVGEEVDKLAHHLLESLERAAGAVEHGPVQQVSVLGLLGIVFDAWAELGWQVMESRTDLVGSAVRLLVDIVWRNQGHVKIAIGFLERIDARDQVFASSVAADVASSILSRLTQEAGDPRSPVRGQGAGQLVSIVGFFQICLDMMLAISYQDAASYIRNYFLDSLSELMSLVLEQTIGHPREEHVAELDMVSTELYELCDRALRCQHV
ncbi:hypothetical protein PHBOTO_003715 [Pseudozyma hubeiensis]|nr:hypothetical protein PHBOTO_003715 [Pseudozyma hubeiensis]